MNTALAVPIAQMGSRPQPALKATIDADALWQAVVEHRNQLDGVFYYGVKTTGVFCRPSCPSRRPRRENVDFYFDPGAAERAGLRACRRCRPTEPRTVNPQAELVKDVCEYIEKNLESTLTLKTIAAEVGGSPFHIQRTFKNLLGITPQEFAEMRRVAVFRTALRFGHTVADATYEAGFNSSRGLYERAHAHLGMTPATYRKGAPSQEIAFTIADSPLGKLLVASTEKGVCKISLGDTAARLSEALFAEFPKALINQDSAPLRTAVRAILDYLTQKTTTIDLPLDLQATTFQMRVWRELQRIPYGHTLSYEEVATRLKQPSATRAVARACASNPVALVVPCHRVIRKDGGLGGYRWGIERKKRLLAAEVGRQSLSS
jgi:AraC family transcriptional regulator, regulatory protein of adaptative response / methylated-DNA-[protein]-cysteine methyltransferase